MIDPADNFSVRVTGSLGPWTLRGIRACSQASVLVLLALFLGLASSARANIVQSSGRLMGVTFRQGVSVPTGAGASQRLRGQATQNGAPSGTLVYHSGPVVHSSAPYVIFWTPPGQSIPTSTQALVERYFTDAAADSGTAGNEFGVVRQYTDATGFADYKQNFSTPSQAITDTSAYPARDATNCPDVASTYPTCITDAQLESEITRVISADGLPGDGTGEPPAAAPVYFVVLPTDVNVCYSENGGSYCADNAICAYHSWYADASNGQNVLYATIPTIILGAGMNPKACQYDGNAAVQHPNGTNADVVLKYLNHEQNEVLTDPYGNAWWDGPGQEAADECNQYGTGGPLSSQSLSAFAPVLGGSASGGTLYNQLIDGHEYYLQSEWSNGGGGCELRPASGSITPRMAISPSTPFTVGTQLTFDPSSSTSSFPYSSATWNFGDGPGTVFESHGAATNPVTHTYAQSGSYTVTETLVDTHGNLATKTQQITVYSNPTAGFTSTTALPYVGGATGFDASSSSDPDSGVTITSYAWNFGDGVTATTSSPTTTHTFVQPGTFTVTLTVTNSVGLTSATTNTVTIHPLPSSVFTPTPTTPLVNQSVSFDGSGSVAASGSITNYKWSFGDGSSPVSGPSASTAHSYSQAGVYQVSLTVTETDGLTRTSTQQLIVGSPPSASYTVTTSSPVQGYPVGFDASASSDSDAGVSIASYSWNFGDGNTLTSATPTVSHAYGQPGTYTVTLTVTNTIDLTSIQSQTVSVDEIPSSVFTLSPSVPPVGQTVSFDGSGSVDPDGSIVGYSWNFGDGSSPVAGASATATHSYTAPGNYTVALTVTDSDGHTRTSSQQLTVGSPPTAALQVTAPSNPVQGSPVSFDASASTDPNSGITISSYNWNFGDGSTATTTSATTSHVYSTPGNDTVTLTVTNSLGLTSPPVTAGIVVDELPTVSFTMAPTAPLAGTVLTFDGSRSQDLDGTIVSYSWNFGDGSTAITATAATTHAYAATGVYPVALTITDSDGHTATLTQPVTVYALPTAAFTSAPQTPIAGAAVTVDAGGSTDPNGSAITSYTWNFGDGSAPVTSSTATASHTYAHPGSYTIGLTITDALGLTATRTRPETINALPVPAFSTAPGTPVNNQLVGFDASGSSDSNHSPITSYRWDFGDGTITTGPSSSASHAYAQAGTYTVLLTVTDGLGLSASLTRTVTIRALPSGAFTTSPQAPEDQLPITFNAGGSSDPNGVAITSYSWNFGDGRSASSGSPTVTHTYANPGKVTVVLTVTDALGLSTSYSRTVVVADEPPIATARVLTAHPVAGQQIAFDGARSLDPDGTISAYTWSFGDHSKTVSGAGPLHSYSTAGTYPVQLTVTDSSGDRAITTVRVTVAPAARITAMKAQMTAHGPVLVITVTGAGTLHYGKKKILVRKAGTVRVRLQLTRPQLQRLDATGALKVHFPITFTPKVGSASNQRPTLVFRVLRQHGLAVSLIRH